MDKLAEFVKNRLQEEIDNKDTEQAHINADAILSDFVAALGYEEISELYNKVKKWYS